MKVTPWPMRTWSSIVTPSQMKVLLETFHRRPIFAFFWISTNVPIFVSSPISQPYRLMNFASLTSFPSLTSDAIQQYPFTDIPPSTSGGARFASTSTLPRDDCGGRREEDLDVGPEGARPGVPEVEAHHFVEGRAATPGHLPESCDPRLGLQDPSAVPGLVLLELVGKRRPRPDQRHVPLQHVPQL